MRRFTGRKIDLGSLGLKLLDLGEIGETAEIRIANPRGCEVHTKWRNGTKHLLTVLPRCPN